MVDRPDAGNGGDVLSSLPSTRPQRRSARRAKPDAAKADAKPKARASASRAAASGRAQRPARPAKRPTTRATGRSARPKAVRPSAATTRAREPGGAGDRPGPAPAGLELIGTAVQAAGEIAQIGLTVGVRTLRGAISKLPRP